MLPNAVLVIEDDTGLRALIERVLRSEGFQVFSAATASEAAALWKECRKEIPVLLVDLTLPDASSGEQLARTLHQENQGTRVILMSGWLPGWERRGEWPEGWMFLQKPFLPNDLSSMVRRAISGQKK